MLVKLFFFIDLIFYDWILQTKKKICYKIFSINSVNQQLIYFLFQITKNKGNHLKVYYQMLNS